MYQRFGQQAQFLLVYVREAHPTDGWKMANSQWTDPKSQAERNLVATKCCQDLKIKFPALVDTMDDATAVAWAAWPERIFVVGVDGRVAYAGEQGPWGFWPTDSFKRQTVKNFGLNKAEIKKPNTKKPDTKKAEGKNSEAQKTTAGTPSPEVPIRNLKSDSLEAFLTRLLPSTAVEVIEPLSAEAQSRTPAAGSRPPSP